MLARRWRARLDAWRRLVALAELPPGLFVDAEDETALVVVTQGMALPAPMARALGANSGA